MKRFAFLTGLWLTGAVMTPAFQPGEADYDLSALGNYHATRGIVPLSDSLIATASAFSEWLAEFLCWPKELWADPAHGVPCQDPEKNAYHVRRLAGAILLYRRWIGPPLVLSAAGVVLDRNHGLRAVQWLAAWGVMVEVPVEIKK